MIDWHIFPSCISHIFNIPLVHLISEAAPSLLVISVSWFILVSPFHPYCCSSSLNIITDMYLPSLKVMKNLPFFFFKGMLSVCLKTHIILFFPLSYFFFNSRSGFDEDLSMTRAFDVKKNKNKTLWRIQCWLSPGTSRHPPLTFWFYLMIHLSPSFLSSCFILSSSFFYSELPNTLLLVLEFLDTLGRRCSVGKCGVLPPSLHLRPGAPRPASPLLTLL